MKQTVPRLSRVAVFMSPYQVPSVGEHLLKDTEIAATTLGVHVDVIRVEQVAGTYDAHRDVVEVLRDLGYVEGRNLEVERRHADGRPERLLRSQPSSYSSTWTSWSRPVPLRSGPPRR